MTCAAVVLVTLLHGALAACRPTVASIHLANATGEAVEASVELVGEGNRVSTVLVAPHERHFLLKYDERSDAASELTALVKAVTFKQRDCIVVRRGAGVVELATRNREHAGWLIAFHRDGSCATAASAIDAGRE